MNRVNGKAIMLKSGDKYFAGVTDTDLSLTPQYTESLIKEDDGKPQEELESVERKISLSGVICINGTEDATTHNDQAALRTMVEAGAKVPFVYGMFTSGKPEITGNLLITGYSEKGGSSGKATYSLEAKICDDDDYSLGATS